MLKISLSMKLAPAFFSWLLGCMGWTRLFSGVLGSYFAIFPLYFLGFPRHQEEAAPQPTVSSDKNATDVL